MLCHAFAQEYLRAHRAFALLARRLTSLGFPVLRFDLHGCGDSAGEAPDGELEIWTRDVGAAIDEAKRAGQVGRVALVGLRLGASLAASAAAGRDDVSALVLWDPVVSGADYLEQLRVAHRDWMEAVGTGAATEGEEALGFPISAKLREGLDQLDLMRVETPSSAAILVVEEQLGTDTTGLVQGMRDSGQKVELHQVTGEGLGATPTELGKPWLPIQTVQNVAAWLGESCR